MHSKQLLLPAIATLLVVLSGSCKKDMMSPEMSSAAMPATLNKPTLKGTLAVVNLGVSGNFVILGYYAP